MIQYIGYKKINAESKIAREAFEHDLSLSVIFIPESVKSIGASAFHGCVNLTTVYPGQAYDLLMNEEYDNFPSVGIPEGVIEIGENAFSDCINLEEMCLS